MSREVQVRFCESLWGKFPRATLLVILARYMSPKLEDWVSTMIEQWLGLELNPLKTSTVRLNHKSQSFDFLSYTFRCVPSKKYSGDFAIMYPSLRAMAKQRETIRAKTSPKLGMVPAPQLVQSLSRQMTGWSRYFNQGYCRRYLRDTSFYALCSVIKHLKRRSQRPYRPPKGVSWYHHVHKQLGLVRL